MAEDKYRGFDIEHIRPPIPDRRYDWCATEENSEGQENLYAPTREELLQEVDRWHEEQDDG